MPPADLPKRPDRFRNACCFVRYLNNRFSLHFQQHFLRLDETLLCKFVDERGQSL